MYILADDIIINRIPGGSLPEPVKTFVKGLDVPLLGTIPADVELINLEFSGTPLLGLGNESPVYQAVKTMMDQILSL